MSETAALDDLATVMRRATYAAYDLTLVGNASPHTRAQFERMTHPVVGDWVIETSTIYRSRGTTDIDAIGILEEVTREKVDFGDPDFVWDEAEEGQPHPTEAVHYIRTIDGRRFRWTNASFVAVPIWRRNLAGTLVESVLQNAANTDNTPPQAVDESSGK